MALNIRACLCLSVLALAGLSAAQSPVGKWRGKFVFDASKVKTAEEKNKFKMAKLSMGGMTVMVTFKADKTYTSTMREPGTPNPYVDMGTWTQAGLVITAKGKFGGSEKMTISNDGKTITMKPSSTFGAGVSVVLKRA